MPQTRPNPDPGMDTEFDPDSEEVFQAEPAVAVPVEVHGIVEVQTLPGKITGFRRFDLSTTLAQRIVDEDPRRKSVTIIPLDADIRLGGDSSSPLSSAGARLPIGVPLLLTTSDEVWAASVTVASEVTVISEYWAR